jgi:hypothetical protein
MSEEQEQTTEQEVTEESPTTETPHGVVTQSEAAQIAEQMATAIRAGKQVWDLLKEDLHKDLIISGKHVDEWKREFHIDIPPDLNPTLLKELNVEMVKKFQEASFRLATARQLATKSFHGTKVSYEAAYLATVAEWKAKGKRMPAASTLENIAKIESTTHDSTSRYAEVEMKFWRDIIDGLDNTRRMIEDATRNVTQELKADQTVRSIDAMNNYNNARRHNYE